MRDITPAQIKAETATAKAVAEQGIETGDLYPLTVEGVGSPTKYRWLNCQTDERGEVHDTYGEALKDAYAQKENLNG